MEKLNRKALKKTAKGLVKKHYWLLVFMCLIAAVLGTEFTDALSFTKLGSSTEVEETADDDDSGSVAETARDAVITQFGLDAAYDAVLNDQAEAYEKAASERDTSEEDVNIGILQIGHSRGVLASVVNSVNNGTLYLVVYNAFRSLTGSKNFGLIFFLLIAIAVYLAFYILVSDVYKVVMSRILLEGRIYDKVPTGRFVYLIRIKRWFKVSLALLRKTVYELLWNLTIVGGVIKGYSYFCVPYILAENPDCSGKDAILLSRKMMNGHKWECFVFNLSFILWDLLSAFTSGLAGLLFVYPYVATAKTEYFVRLRNYWIENKLEGCEIFNDKYLYEKADQALLDQTYADIAELRKRPEEKFAEGHKIAKFFAVNFGIILRHDEEEMKYLKSKSIKQRIVHGTMILDGKMYPARLSAIPEKEKDKNLEAVGYMRCYTIASIILIFFTMCFIGWIWEVSLHLISEHRFVNRGVLHGPWLPIYGMGGTIILLLLNRVRKKPALHFFLGMLLAGVVEYFTAWNLEMTHNGQKWWDYSGYFLNLHGRVCAEGLLVFGLGGMAIAYIVAPMLDNLFRKIPKKVVIPLCSVLLVIYCCDQVYSHYYPNQGDGITNTSADAGTIITSADIEIPLLTEGVSLE